jgi:hypothetical protein
MARKSSIRTTTVRLPEPIYEQAKAMVKQDKDNKGSLNDLFVIAIEAYLRMRKRRQIDAEFAGMASDIAYQKESSELTSEFEHSDWEALNLEPLEGGTGHGRNRAR